MEMEAEGLDASVRKEKLLEMEKRREQERQEELTETNEERERMYEEHFRNGAAKKRGKREGERVELEVKSIG